MRTLKRITILFALLLITTISFMSAEPVARFLDKENYTDNTFIYGQELAIKVYNEDQTTVGLRLITNDGTKIEITDIIGDPENKERTVIVTDLLKEKYNIKGLCFAGSNYFELYNTNDSTILDTTPEFTVGVGTSTFIYPFDKTVYHEVGFILLLKFENIITDINVWIVPESNNIRELIYSGPPTSPLQLNRKIKDYLPYLRANKNFKILVTEKAEDNTLNIQPITYGESEPIRVLLGSIEKILVTAPTTIVKDEVYLDEKVKVTWESFEHLQTVDVYLTEFKHLEVLSEYIFQDKIQDMTQTENISLTFRNPEYADKTFQIVFAYEDSLDGTMHELGRSRPFTIRQLKPGMYFRELPIEVVTDKPFLVNWKYRDISGNTKIQLDLKINNLTQRVTNPGNEALLEDKSFEIEKKYISEGVGYITAYKAIDDTTEVELARTNTVNFVKSFCEGYKDLIDIQQDSISKLNLTLTDMAETFGKTLGELQLAKDSIVVLNDKILILTESNTILLDSISKLNVKITELSNGGDTLVFVYLNDPSSVEDLLYKESLKDIVMLSHPFTVGGTWMIAAPVDIQDVMVWDINGNEYSFINWDGKVYFDQKTPYFTISGLPAGVYILGIKVKDSYVFSKFIVNE